MINLRLCLFSLQVNNGGEYLHAQEAMDRLNITYYKAVPQSLFDCWDFWNCINVPKELPIYLKIMNNKPENMVGLGLNEEDIKYLGGINNEK